MDDRGYRHRHCQRNGVVTGVKAGTTKVICTVGDVKCETIVRVTDKKS